MLSQMAPFCLNSRGDPSLPAHSFRQQPQWTFSLEQIRLWTISNNAQSSDSHQPRLHRCQQRMWTLFYTPLSFGVSAPSCKQRKLSELVLTWKHKLFFFFFTFHFSVSFKSIFLSLISMTVDMGLGRRVFLSWGIWRPWLTSLLLRRTVAVLIW